MKDDEEVKSGAGNVKRKKIFFPLYFHLRLMDCRRASMPAWAGEGGVFGVGLGWRRRE
jgi:hypothetical protein